MLHAHSLLEAQLYLKMTGCEKCNPEPAAIRASKEATVQSGATNIVQVRGRCPVCGADQAMDFAMENPDALPASGPSPAINLTEKRSQIIDIGQWLTLAHLFVQESRTETNRERARSLNLQSAQCLDEALKFYDEPDNDLPPSDAFYCDSSRRRFRDFPQQFSRSRLINERRKLPVTFPI